MYKKTTLIILLLLLLTRLPAFAAERQVSNMSDNYAEGTLRVILQDACDDSGDDTISFSKTRRSQIKLTLIEPLVIPRNCRGSVTLEGSNQVDTILDASSLSGGGIEAGDSCILHVYSDDHTIKNFSFINNELGAGVCFFGRNNRIEDSRFGITQLGVEAPNRYGVVATNAFLKMYSSMNGSGNQITSNTIISSSETGVWVRANGVEIESNEMSGSESNGIWVTGNEVAINDNEIIGNGNAGIWIESADSTISSNSILANGGCPDDYLSSHTGDCFPEIISTNEAVGIYVNEGSSNIVIGYSNTIQYNYGGGVYVMGDKTEGIKVTHNSIANNYGEGVGIDLAGDGITKNDIPDDDEGPNHFLNFLDHLQAFHLVSSTSDESARYWTWGVSLYGSRVELYEVSDHDRDREIDYGGGEEYVGSYNVSDFTFELSPDSFTLWYYHTFTALVFDDAGNTSEYSQNMIVGPDEDMDGIIDRYEIDDESGGTEGSDYDMVDTDEDGLPDSAEDKNRNGVWNEDKGETIAYTADSDGDGLSDYYEIRGDGIYNEGIDTNPLVNDTDGDGLLDGEEDTNQNGIWESYLAETSPLSTDSDSDGVSDALDNCPVIYNPGQEEWYCFI